MVAWRPNVVFVDPGRGHDDDDDDDDDDDGVVLASGRWAKRDYIYALDSSCVYLFLRPVIQCRSFRRSASSVSNMDNSTLQRFWEGRCHDNFIPNTVTPISAHHRVSQA